MIDVILFIGLMIAIFAPPLRARNWRAWRKLALVYIGIQTILILGALANVGFSDGLGFLHFITFEPFVLALIYAAMFRGWSWSGRQRPSLLILVPVAVLLVPLTVRLHYLFI